MLMGHHWCALQSVAEQVPTRQTLWAEKIVPFPSDSQLGNPVSSGVWMSGNGTPEGVFIASGSTIKIPDDTKQAN